MVNLPSIIARVCGCGLDLKFLHVCIFRSFVIFHKKLARLLYEVGIFSVCKN